MNRSLLSLCAGLVALTAMTMHAATYNLAPTAVDTLWNAAASWYEGDFPRTAGDSAVISNECVGGGTSWRALNINTAITCGVIRVDGFTTNMPYPSLRTTTGSTLYLHNPDGAARIIGAGWGGGSWQVDVGVALVLLSDLHVTVVSGKIVNIGSTLSGASNLYLTCGVPGSTRLGFRSSTSPAYTGTIHINGRMSMGQNVAFQCTNAEVIVHSGSDVEIYYTTNIGRRIVMYNATKMSTAYGLQSFLATPIEIHGTITNDAASGGTGLGRRMTWFSPISGTGAIVRASNTYTNRYLGSVSPGFSAGTITFRKITSGAAGGSLILGEPGAPFLLIIDDGDQVRVENTGETLDISNLDVRFTATTAPGTTNWFLYCDDGFTGAAFNQVDWGVFSGSIIMDAPGMENYIGAVVVPEPAVLAGALGMALLAARRRR